MSVALLIQAGSNNRTDTSDPWTFSVDFGATAPKAVVVGINNYTTATDQITSVSVGGVSLTEVVQAVDTATETTNTQLWFVGSGLTGLTSTQTVSIDLASATGDDMIAWVVGFSAAKDVEVVDFDSISENTANPQVTLQTGGRSCLAVCNLSGGSAAVSDYGLLSGMSTLSSQDTGQEIQRWDVQTTASTSDFTIGYSIATSDDVSFVALTMAEVTGTVTRAYGQSQAKIKATTTVYGQSQVWLKTTSKGYGQAQATIAVLSAYDAAVIADSPVLYLPMQETGGITAEDIVSTHDGTYTGGYTLGVSGPFGANAVDLNGSTGYITIPDHADLDLADGPFSLEIWMNRDTEVWMAYLINKGYQAYGASLEEGGGYNRQVYLRGGATTLVAESTVSIAAATWYHIVLTKNGSTRQVIVDGVDVTNNLTDLTLVSTNDPLRIGADQTGTIGYDGKVSRFALYNKALTVSEALTHYQAASGTSGSTGRKSAQAQAWIKATSQVFANAQSRVKQTYQSVAQAQTKIRITSPAFGQAQVWIKALGRGYANSLASVKASSRSYGQSLAQIKQTYQGFAQAQAKITRVDIYQAVGQSQAWIKNTYRNSAQAQTWIKTVGLAAGQAQSKIKQTYQANAQANALIKRTQQSFAQANATIIKTYQAAGQAQAKIKALGVQGYAQAQAKILGMYRYEQVAQAQARIKQVYQVAANAQAQVKAIGQGYAQALASIKTAYKASGQANTWVKAVGRGTAQAQASVVILARVYAQAQARIKAISQGFGQAMVYTFSETAVVVRSIRVRDRGVITMTISEQKLSMTLRDREGE